MRHSRVWLLYFAEERAHDELKPCPFCGSSKVFFTPDEEQQLDSTTTGFIWCHGCDFSSDSFYSRKTAIEKWNRRVDNG